MHKQIDNTEEKCEKKKTKKNKWQNKIYFCLCIKDEEGERVWVCL